MKKIILLGLICSLAICAFQVYDWTPEEDRILTDAERTVIEQKKSHKARNARAAAEWIHMNRGDVDPALLAEVRADIAQHRLEKADGLLEWEEKGPNNVGGRTRAIMFDKDDPNKMIVGGVAGGIWMSFNAGQLWTPIQDSFDKGCIVVSSITQTSNGDIYVGTGEGFASNWNGTGWSGAPGSGLYKSTDGGFTWSLCNGTDPGSNPINTGSDWASIDKLAAHPSNPAIVYAATQGGMYMTKNAGSSWERIKNTNGGNITGGRGWDVKAGSNGKIHFLTGTKYYRSISDDVFEEISGGNVPTTGGRKVLTINETDPNLLYVGTEGGFCISTVKRSTDGGDNWETIATGSVVFHPGGANAEQCQASYDFAICSHPTNPDIVFVAGVVLWRGIRQGNAWDWQLIDSWFDDPTSVNYVHADKHDIKFKPGTADEMYVVSDGGVSRTQNASDLVPIFEVRNKNFNVTQFYSVAADLDGKILAGAQDNGTQFLNCTTNSSNTAVEVVGGDGGFTEISNINPNAVFAEVQFGDLRRSSNGGDGFAGSMFDCNIDCLPGTNGDCAGDGVIDGGGAFIAPFYLWEDADLYHKVKAITLGPNEQSKTETIGLQDFTVTRNANLLALVPDETYQDMKATLALDQIFIEWDEETNQVKDYGPNDFRYVRSRFYMGDLQGGLWMTLDALNFQTTPFWTKIGDAAGSIRSITSSPDGNTVWAGTTSGSLMRVNNLDEIDINDIRENDTDDCTNNGIATFEDYAQTKTGASGRTITGISTHPFNVNKVYFSVGGYNSSDHVYEISNASDSDMDDIEIDGISGNLPHMPVYDLVVTNPQGYIVAATEYGMWLGDLSQPEASMWTEENGGDMDPVPVFRVREEGMAKVDPGVNTYCKVLYVGTHGRGAFRSTSLTNGGCGEAVIGGCQIVFSGVEEIAETELTVFPNPASDFATVNFDINENQDLQVSVYALTGQLVNRIDRFEAYAGNNKLEINVGDVPNGEYIVVLRSGDYQASTKLNVAH